MTRQPRPYMRAGLFVLLLIVLGTLLYRQRTGPDRTTETTWTVMGTIASVRVPPGQAARIHDIQSMAARQFDAVNTHLSVYLADSDISRFNASTSTVSIAPLTEELLRASADLYRQTDGLFDPTLFPLIQLWGFSGGPVPTNVPAPQAIQAALARTGHEHIQVANGRAWRTRPDLSYDTGGIAKGFAVDLAYQKIVQQYPDTPVLINLGGEIRVQGQATPERPWRIGVQHPFAPGQTVGILALKSGMAVATSGHYERFFALDGQRYAHILDPRTGYPVSGTAGTTVVTPTSTLADVLSTALFVGGHKHASTLMARFPQARVLIIPDEQPLRIYLSDNMRPLFTPAPPYEDALRPLPDSD